MMRSTLIGLLLVCAACSQWVRYGLTTDSGAEPHYQSNRYYIGFQYNTPNGTTGVSYVVGTTLGGNDVAGSRDLYRVDGTISDGTTQQETQYFTDPLPEGITLYISLKYTDGVFYANTTFQVGSTLVASSTQYECNRANYWVPVDASGVRYTPNTPALSLSFNAATSEFVFQVVASYVLWDWTYVLDFVPFAPTATTLATPQFGLAATSCENRQPAMFSSPVTSAPYPYNAFARFFNAAPTATFVNKDTNVATSHSLNSDNFLAYVAQGHWGITPVAGTCDRVRYRANMTFTDLFGCKKTDGTTPAIVIVASSGNMVFKGTLHVTGISPLNITDPTAGYQSVEWEFPFQFLFNMTVEGVASSDTSLLSFRIIRVWFVAPTETTVVLNTRIETDSLAAGAFVSTSPLPVVLSYPYVPAANPGNVTHSVVNVTGDQQVQLFDIISNQQSRQNTDKFTGVYSLRCNRKPSAAAQGVNVTIQYRLSIRAEEVTIVNTGAFGIGLTFMSNPAYTFPATTPYEPSDAIFVRTEVMTKGFGGVNVALPASQKDAFSANIVDVWVCRTTNGLAPTTGTCRTNGVGNVVTLKKIYGTASSNDYGVVAVVGSGVAGAQKYNGFQFAAATLAADLGAAGTTRFWVDVVMYIQNGTSITKRNSLIDSRALYYDEESGVEGGSINTSPSKVVTPQGTDKTKNAVCDVTCIIGLGMGGIVLMLLVLVVVLLVRRRSNKKKEDMADFSDLHVEVSN